MSPIPAKFPKRPTGTQTRRVYPRLDLMNIDFFSPNTDKICSIIDYLCQKSINTCQNNPGVSFSQIKKNVKNQPDFGEVLGYWGYWGIYGGIGGN